MRIHLSQRESAAGETFETLELEAVERCWVQYNELADFVEVNEESGFEVELAKELEVLLPGVDRRRKKTSPDGFAKYLELALGGGPFAVAFNGDDVHVTAPLSRVHIPALWRGKLPALAEAPEFGVATPMGSAAMYDEATGVKGWKSEWNEVTKRIDLTPPPGYTICYDAQGRPGLFRASTLTKIGLSIRKIAE